MHLKNNHLFLKKYYSYDVNAQFVRHPKSKYLMSNDMLVHCSFIFAHVMQIINKNRPRASACLNELVKYAYTKNHLPDEFYMLRFAKEL